MLRFCVANNILVLQYFLLNLMFSHILYFIVEHGCVIIILDNHIYVGYLKEHDHN